jgi:hypothetical protein
MKMLEIPFTNITVGFLKELQENGMVGVVDGDKKTVQLKSVHLVNIATIKTSKSAARQPN